MADSDDLLSADEIEALIQAAQSGAPDSAGQAPAAPASRPAPPAAAQSGSDLLDAGDIEALMKGNAPATRPRSSGTSVESTLQRAENQLAAAMASQAPRGIPPELGNPSPFSYPELGSGGSRTVESFPLSALQDVELDLRIELGRTELLIEEVLKLREGSVVPLDKLAGDPVDILVNGRLVARGEVLVLNDNFCVRVAEILTPDG